MEDDIRARAQRELQDRLREHKRAIQASGIVERVRAMQTPMVEAAQSCFSESELGHLRSLIRITLEFHDYLKADDKDPDNLTYVCESAFAAVESFMTVTHAYKVLVGALDSRIEWGGILTASLKERYVLMFQEFVAETNFENKCRLLLDLFKLQLVWAAISYD